MDPQQWEKVKDLFEFGEPMTPAECDRARLAAEEGEGAHIGWIAQIQHPPSP